MAKTNRDRVSEGLELLNKGLLPFIEREMKAIHGDKWKEESAKWFAAGGEGAKKVNWNDPQTALVVMWDQWNTVFRNTLGHAERSLVSELREVRKPMGSHG